MTRTDVFFAMAVLISMAVALTSASAQQITPPSPIQVNSPIVTINNSPGDQTDAHVDKDFAVYTDSTPRTFVTTNSPPELMRPSRVRIASLIFSPT
jgi:hypothetical protein